MHLSLGAGWRKTDKFCYLCRRMRASVKKIYASFGPDALVAFWLGVWWICNLFQAGFTELANDEAYTICSPKTSRGAISTIRR